MAGGAEIWVRLAMIDRTGVDLGTDAKARLDELSLLHPEWQLETEQRDEFPAGWALALNGEGLCHSAPSP